MTPFAWMCLVFVVLLLMRMPVAFAIVIASFVGYAAIPDPFGAKTSYGLLTDMTGGVHKIALVAIPFFILAGRLMGSGGIARRLIALSNALVGWIRGGTGYVNVLTSMFFGGVSGSAVADVSSVGSILIPLMKEEGYDLEFSTAVTVSSSTIGLIIPPSNVMILFAVVAGGTQAVSGAYKHVDLGIGTMFLAGMLPGIMTGLILMLAVGILSGLRGYPKGSWRGIAHVLACAGRAIFALVVVAIILGGILFGFLTAADSAAVAVVVALVVGVLIYRELPIRQVPGIVREAVVTTGVVFFLIAASNAMKFVFLDQGIDQVLLDVSQSLTTNRVVFLLILNVVLLIFGTFMDMTPAVLIFTPLFLPVAVEYGVHPIHFGIILLVNLCIGLCTPPVGNCLFVGCGLSKVPLIKMIRPMLPFYAAMLLALLAVTYFEPVTMWLPDAWGGWFPQVTAAP